MNKEIDILLINPFSWIRDGSPAYLPYGVLYLAGYLRGKGIRADIFDTNTDPSDPLEVVSRKRPLAIGLSVLTGPVINEALKISRAAKSRFKDIKIIWGGLHPTLFPKYVLEEDSVDYIVQAEGENAIYRLMDALLKGKEDFSIRNLGYRDKGNIFINLVEDSLIDLNLSPLPAWDLVDIHKYVANRFFASRVLTMNTSRDAPLNALSALIKGYLIKDGAP